MSAYFLPMAALGALILWCAWRERVAGNRRDARLWSSARRERYSDNDSMVMYVGDVDVLRPAKF